MMETPPDDTDARRKRHSAARRLVAILLCAVIFVGGMGVVFGLSGGDLLDDFEDGDTDGWSSQGVDFEATTDAAFQGTYGGEMTFTTGPSNPNFRFDWGDQGFDTTPMSVSVWFKEVQRTSDTRIDLREETNFPLRIFSRNGWLYIEESSATPNKSFQFPQNQYVQINFKQIDYSSNSYTLSILDTDNSELYNETGVSFSEPTSGFDDITFSPDTDSNSELHVDNLRLNAVDLENIDGHVTDQEGDGIEDATVEAVNASDVVEGTASTNDTGYYSINLPDGTYNLTAYKDGYVNETHEVTISGSDATQDFTLVEDTSALQIDTRLFIEHGETVPYTIIHGKADGTRENVTASATVTSNNTSVVTVDTSSFELNATDDTSVNERTYITAEYTRSDGETLTQTQNVTVANKTVANLDILPPVTRFSATLDDKTIQTILIATGVGVAAAILATSFAGIAAVTLIMVMGWVMGLVPDGLIMVTVLTAMFIGMNVAGNVDYTVRR